MTWRKSELLDSLLVCAFVAFLLLSRAPQAESASSRKLGPGIKAPLKVKLHKATAEANPKDDHVAFDPLVQRFEQQQDDELWEREHHLSHEERAAYEEHMRHAEESYGGEDFGEGWEHDFSEVDEDMMEHREEAAEEHEAAIEEHSEHEDYQNAEYFETDSFNVSERLAVLFPLIDDDPADHLISLKELTAWHIKQSHKANVHRTRREMETSDKNRDGFISIKEYLGDDTPGDVLKTDWQVHEKEWMKSTVEQLLLADVDGDGKLSPNEFHDFLHPEDSKNEKLHHWLLKEELRHRDTDVDHKLSFAEFRDSSLYEELRSREEDDHEQQGPAVTLGGHGGHATGPEVEERLSRHKFDEFDKDKSGSIDEDEFRPIMDKILPGEAYYARQQSDHIMEQADMNHDYHLSLEEMQEHPFVFYDMSHEEEHTQDFHDEF